MPKPSPQLKGRLRKVIEASLQKQGFRIRDDRILLPSRISKEKIRSLHRIAVQHRVEDAESRLSRFEDQLLDRIASGTDIDPNRIAPRLIEVLPRTDNELLFRYACLHWSVPTSSGYGRRLRFLVEDAQNGKLIGLFGLCDPVFSVGARDSWIGWDLRNRKKRLRNVMEAFILGAVPPYSHLLGGKLVATLCASDEVRHAFRRKYGQGISLIKRKAADGRLALIVTSSALGRSSVYNRVRYQNRRLMLPIGFTGGWGEFQFANGAYSKIREYAESFCDQTAKHESWGTGFRNRREVIRRVLASVGLSGQWMNHGVRRELFVMPLAKNSCEFLRDECNRLRWYHQSAAALADYSLTRWVLPRAERNHEYLDYSGESFRLWKKHGRKSR